MSTRRNNRTTVRFLLVWWLDDLKNSTVAYWFNGLWHYLRAALPGMSADARLEQLAQALRRFAYLKPRFIGEHLWKELSAPAVAADIRARQIGWSARDKTQRGTGGSQGHSSIGTSVVLRAPTAADKGVLYISFEYNWMELARSGCLAKVMQHFYVVGATSWSPTNVTAMACAAGLAEDPLFLGISHLDDIKAFRVAQPTIRPVSQLASDWIDTSEFPVVEKSARDIDIIMIAHWASWKRHAILFDALARLPSSLNIVLIGRDMDGRTANTVLDEATSFGVRQQITAFTDINATAVRKLLSRAKVSLSLSAREGSCVGVAEALAADCPVACLRSSHIGSLAYINEATGRRASRARLAAAVSELLECCRDMHPRAWYEIHSGCWNASRGLEEELGVYAMSKGRRPDTPMAPLKWTYVPAYARAQDARRLLPAREFLERECGVKLLDFVPPDSRDRMTTLWPARAGITLS